MSQKNDLYEKLNENENYTVDDEYYNSLESNKRQIQYSAISSHKQETTSIHSQDDQQRPSIQSFADTKSVIESFIDYDYNVSLKDLLQDEELDEAQRMSQFIELEQDYLGLQFIQEVIIEEEEESFSIDTTKYKIELDINTEQENLNSRFSPYKEIPQIQRQMFSHSFIRQKMALLKLQLEKQFEEGSEKGSILALTTATVGAGIISVPLSFYQSGVIFSLMQYIVCAIIGMYSCMLLIDASIISESYSYMGLADAVCKDKLLLFIKINYFINNWFYAVGYIVLLNKIVTHTLQQIFENSIPYIMRNPDSPFWGSILTAFMIFPICLYRNLSALSKFCFLNLIFILTTSLIIMSQSFNEKVDDFYKNLSLLQIFQIRGVIETFPTAVFSYGQQSNVQDIFHELKLPTRDRMRRVIKISIMISCSIFCLIGFFGYATFADRTDQLTKDDQAGVIVVADYGNKNIPIFIASLLMVISIITAFPFLIKPTKDAFVNIFQIDDKRNIIHFILIFGCCFGALTLAVSVTNMSDIILLTGSASSPLISFVFPAIFYLRTNNQIPYYEQLFLKYFMIGFMCLFSIWGVLDFFFKFSQDIVDR